LIELSSGPGTNTKWVSRMIRGYPAIKSAKDSKFSVIQVSLEELSLGTDAPHLDIVEHLFQYLGR
jgi:hypothetical protein